MIDYPAEWKAMVKEWVFPESVYDASAGVCSTPLGMQSLAVTYALAINRFLLPAKPWPHTCEASTASATSID
eukprot:11088106-Karenia_brevis.AAC.1